MFVSEIDGELRRGCDGGDGRCCLGGGECVG